MFQYVVLQTRSFCRCQPGPVRFLNGSIIIVIILEYEDSTTSQEVNDIISLAKEEGIILPGYETLEVVIYHPGGGMYSASLTGQIL